MIVNDIFNMVLANYPRLIRKEKRNKSYEVANTIKVKLNNSY